MTVFDAKVVGGTPQSDGEETSELGWFLPEDLPFDHMGGSQMLSFVTSGSPRTDSLPHNAVHERGA